MATTCYGRPDAEATEPATPIQGPALALGQMALTIEDGLLMVLGPEGDPVPPQAFVDAAAVRPEALLNLPDGAPVPASRVAAVLDFQIRGRPDGAEQGADWILAMLRDRDLPAAAAGDVLEAERASCVLTAAGGQLTIACDAGAFRIVDVAPLSATGDAMGLFLGDDAPISVAGLIALIHQQDAPQTAADEPETGEEAGGEVGRADQPASDELVLRGGTIEVRADGLWLGVPGFAAHGGGVHLARWATSAPNGPVVGAVLADGRTASLADLIGFGLAAGAGIEGSHEVAAAEHDQATVGVADVLAPSGEDPGFSTDREGGDPCDTPIPDGSAEVPHDTFPCATAEPGSGPGECIERHEQTDPTDSVSEPAGNDPSDTIAGDHAKDADDAPCDGRLAGDAVEQQADIAPADKAPRELEVAHTEPADAEQADIDPDSILLVVIRGVPEDALLSAGMRDDDGSWSLLPADLPSVVISLGSRGSDGDACGEARDVDGDLDITGIALAEDGTLVAISETVPLAHYLEDPAGDLAQLQDVAAEPADHPAGAPGPCGIPLEVDPQAWAGERFDALVIRDLPAGVSLSAGTYDPAIDAWVLRAQDLSALAVLPPAGFRASFTVTLMGVALRSGDVGAARMLARLPVTLA